MKKVIMLFSMSFQPYQGRYLRVYNQATSLVRAGYDVTLLAWDRECKFPQAEEIDGIHVRRFWIRAGIGQGPKNIVNVLKFNFAVLRHLLRADVDVIHNFNMDAIVFGLLAAKLRGKRAVLDLCEPEYYAFWDDKYRLLLRGINWLESFLAKRFNQVFVHNLFQVRKFSDAGVRRLTQVGSYPNRRMLAAPRESSALATVVIGRLGTIYEDNGLEELVAGFQRLVEKQAGDGRTYKLLLAGRVYDSYRATFDALIQPLGDQVIVHGAFQVSDTAALYRQIDISTVLARRTRWFRNITPTKLFDSLANGVPVLASDIGDIRDILSEADCGEIVDESNPDSICEGIAKLLADPARFTRLGTNALDLARRKYTWEVYESRFLDAYAALVRA